MRSFFPLTVIKTNQTAIGGTLKFDERKVKIVEQFVDNNTVEMSKPTCFYEFCVIS